MRFRSTAEYGDRQAWLAGSLMLAGLGGDRLDLAPDP